jgi:pyridoxamine 5'-phosphate oxidase
MTLSEAGLTEAEADADPIRQFARWFQEALAAGVPEANAMTLATCSPDGRPAARVVLLKGYDQNGFTFFTNYTSRKARELTANPQAALVFFWPEMKRQIRIEGTTSPTTADESDAYFASRPADSQLGAWASDQSAVIGSREELEARFRLMQGRFAGGAVPRPPHWGGYRLAPDLLEFWQGRPFRLHDRLCYTRQADGTWKRQRLAP